MYDEITEEDVNLGLPTVDVDAILGLADAFATRPSLIVHVETMARLRKWADDEA